MIFLKNSKGVYYNVDSVASIWTEKSVNYDICIQYTTGSIERIEMYETEEKAQEVLDKVMYRIHYADPSNHVISLPRESKNDN